MSKIVLFTLSVLAVLCTAQSASLAREFGKSCSTTFTLSCFKLDMISWMDSVSPTGAFNILPGVSVVREVSNEARSNNQVIVSELAREFPSDVDSRINAFFMRKASDLLGSLSLKFNLADVTSVESARKKGDKSGMGLFFVMAAMMKGVLGAMTLAGAAALAAKAITIGLVSLLVSAVIGIGSLKKDDHVEYISTKAHDRFGHRSFSDDDIPAALKPGYKP